MKVEVTKVRLDELQGIYDAALAAAIQHPELCPPDFTPENCAMAALLGAVEGEEGEGCALLHPKQARGIMKGILPSVEEFLAEKHAGTLKR